MLQYWEYLWISWKPEVSVVRWVDVIVGQWLVHVLVDTQPEEDDNDDDDDDVQEKRRRKRKKLCDGDGLPV